MKKILYILCAMVAFASCSKEEIPTIEGGQNADGSYTFNIGIEEPDYVPKSRAAVTMGRYVLEMYEGDLTATPVKMTNTTGVFNVELTKNTDYVCLFWADNGTDYTATDLKAVKQADETKPGTAAYAAKVTVNSKTFNGAITLKRAVAELSFIDKNGLTEATNSLKITYPYASATLNVGDGTLTHATGTAVRTIENIAPPATATTAFVTDYVLAPTEAGKIAGLKFQLNTEAEKTIAETAIQANFRTKITGEYWKDVLKVGSYYYDDNTFSNTIDVTKTCIGIVYVVNADGKIGKIVSLDEVTKVWSTETIATGATSDTDGAANTAKVLASASYTAAKYPAFALCATKNTTAPAGISWYIPAKEELKALYGKYTDGTDDNVDASVKTAVNISLNSVSGAAVLSDAAYWSSTEGSGRSAWYVSFNGGNTGNGNKGNYGDSFRVVSAFDLDAQPAPKPVEAVVGDFYMKDGTWLPGATTLTAEQQANCIGIVYWLGDPTANDAALKTAHPNCTNGLVVSLKEDGSSAWQSTYTAYGKNVNEWTIANTTYAPIISGDALADPINKIMGYNNTKAIQAFNAANSANKVEAIEKVAAYQTAVPTPANNSGWFLPSEKELTLLCGLDNQDANVYDDDYGTANRIAINAQLAKITGSTQISQDYYRSSTEYNVNYAWSVNFFNGTTGYFYKDNSNSSVRVVSAF